MTLIGDHAQAQAVKNQLEKRGFFVTRITGAPFASPYHPADC